jgi:hypothetical protein
VPSHTLRSLSPCGRICPGPGGQAKGQELSRPGHPRSALPGPVVVENSTVNVTGDSCLSYPGVADATVGSAHRAGTRMSSVRTRSSVLAWPTAATAALYRSNKSSSESRVRSVGKPVPPGTITSITQTRWWPLPGLIPRLTPACFLLRDVLDRDVTETYLCLVGSPTRRDRGRPCRLRRVPCCGRRPVTGGFP